MVPNMVPNITNPNPNFVNLWVNGIINKCAMSELKYYKLVGEVNYKCMCNE